MTRIEAALEEAIAHGAQRGDDHVVARARERPRARAARARAARDPRRTVCSSAARTAWASTTFATASGPAASRRARIARGGNVAFISHSGSGMCGIVDTDERSTSTSSSRPGRSSPSRWTSISTSRSTCPPRASSGCSWKRVRNPAGLRRALEKANARRIPVVAHQGRPHGARGAARPSRIPARWRARMPATTRCSTATACSASTTWTQLSTALIMFAQPHAVGSGRPRLDPRLGRRAAAADRPRAHAAGVPSHAARARERRASRVAARSGAAGRQSARCVEHGRTRRTTSACSTASRR